MHLATGDVEVVRSVLPLGVAAVDETVKQMARIAHSNYGSKSPKIRALAINIVRAANIQDKDYYGEIIAIHEWVKNNIRYFRDPVGQETLSYPEEMAFNTKGGDCDDMTVLEIALLGSIGISAYPVCIGVVPGLFSHVYLYAQVPPGKGRHAGETLPLDPIMKEWPAGKEAPANRVKIKKTFPQYADPLGKAMSGQDLAGLGAYAFAPSYLDDDNSPAGKLLVPDTIDLHADRTTANGMRVTQRREGVDAMFSATSPGDAGTITETKDGQLVPKGFIRDEPSRSEIMAMRPAGKDRTGPLGPITARKAEQFTSYLSEGKEYAAQPIDAARGARVRRIDASRKITTIKPAEAAAAKVVSVADEEKKLQKVGEMLAAAEMAGDMALAGAAAWWAKQKGDWARNSGAPGLAAYADRLAGLGANLFVREMGNFDAMGALNVVDAQRLMADDLTNDAQDMCGLGEDTSMQARLNDSIQKQAKLQKKLSAVEAKIMELRSLIAKKAGKDSAKGIRAAQVNGLGAMIASGRRGGAYMQWQPTANSVQSTPAWQQQIRAQTPWRNPVWNPANGMGPVPSARPMRRGFNGMGEFDIVGTLKKPVVYIPLALLGAALIWRLVRSRKSGAAPAATTSTPAAAK